MHARRLLKGMRVGQRPGQVEIGGPYVVKGKDGGEMAE